MKTLSIVIALAFSAALSGNAMAQARVLELGHEATSDMIRLPTSANGELTLQPCATCKVVRLRATAETRYTISGTPVTLQAMTKFLAMNPTAHLVVMQLKDAPTLTRIVVTGPAGAQ